MTRSDMERIEELEDSIRLKSCPYRIHGERTMSLTIQGEYYYNEFFMPCLGVKCACFHDDGNDAYCDRNGAYMSLTRGEQDDQRIGN